MGYTYQYPRPAVTVDIMLITDEPHQRILLIERKNPPFQGSWAFPGGFVDPDETLEQAACRELKEETGLEVHDLEQFKTFSDPNRDPRGRTISTVFFSKIDVSMVDKTVAGDDASNAEWFLLEKLPKLAFDHKIIIQQAQHYKIF